MTHFLERHYEGIEVLYVCVVEERGKLSPMLCDKLLQRRQHIFGNNVAEARQSRSIK